MTSIIVSKRLALDNHEPAVCDISSKYISAYRRHALLKMN